MKGESSVISETDDKYRTAGVSSDGYVAQVAEWIVGDGAVEVVGARLEDVLCGVVAVLEGIAEVSAGGTEGGTTAQTRRRVLPMIRINVDCVVILLYRCTRGEQQGRH